METKNSPLTCTRLIFEIFFVDIETEIFSAQTLSLTVLRVTVSHYSSWSLSALWEQRQSWISCWGAPHSYLSLSPLSLPWNKIDLLHLMYWLVGHKEICSDWSIMSNSKCWSTVPDIPHWQWHTGCGEGRQRSRSAIAWGHHHTATTTRKYFKSFFQIIVC